MCGKRILQVDACRGHDERDSWSVAKRLSTVTLRPNEATVLYNAACVLGSMNKNRKPWTPFARLGTFLNSPFNSLLSLTSPLQRL